MIIETKCLCLREFRLEDRPDLYAYQSDPPGQRFYPEIVQTPEQVQDFVKSKRIYRK